MIGGLCYEKNVDSALLRKNREEIDEAITPLSEQEAKQVLTLVMYDQLRERRQKLVEQADLSGEDGNILFRSPDEHTSEQLELSFEHFLSQEISNAANEHRRKLKQKLSEN